MHVWIIECKASYQKTWHPIAGSCKKTRGLIRQELKWQNKNRPHWTYRIAKYTSTKGK